MTYFNQLETNSTVTEKIRAIYNQRKGKYKVFTVSCKMSWISESNKKKLHFGLMLLHNIAWMMPHRGYHCKI